jgi:hypothetical protein
MADFKKVEGITDFLFTNKSAPGESVYVGDTIELFATVSPSDATHNEITSWIIDPDDKDPNRGLGTISGNVLTPTKKGVIKVRAVVKNGLSPD